MVPCSKCKEIICISESFELKVGFEYYFQILFEFIELVRHGDVNVDHLYCNCSIF